MAFWSRQRKRSRRSSRSTHLASRRLTSERLEERLVLSSHTFGATLLPDDFMVRQQTDFDSVASVAANDTNRIAVFSGKGPIEGNGVFAEVVDPNGSAVARLRVNSTLRGVQGSAVVDSNSDGKFVVAWAGRGRGDRQGIFFQRFDADGTPLGGETLANTTVGGVQTAPAIAMAKDGSFFIAWSGVGEGDFSGVFLRRFDATGTALGNEVLVNTTTGDHQQGASLAFNSDGDLIVAWQSLHQDGEDWGVFAQRFSSTGSRLGSETQLSTTTDGSQTAPTLATDPTGGFVAAWQSRGQDGDGWGVVAHHFENDLTPTANEVLLNDSTAGNQQNVSLAVAADGQWLAAWSTGILDGAGWEVATRSIGADISTSAPETVHTEFGGLDSGHQNSPQVAIEGGTARVVWSGAGKSNSQGGFNQSIDLVLIDNQSLFLDLNGSAQTGNGSTADFVAGGGAATIADAKLSILGAGAGVVTGATARLQATPDGQAESLAVDTSGTAITAVYDSATRTLTLSGSDSEANYQQVLRTLGYNNTASSPNGNRSIVVRVTDSDESASQTIGVSTVAPDLVAFAKAIGDSGARFFGASWNSASTAQKELFQDGGNALPFLEATNPDRTANQLALDNNVIDFPTWVFSDNSRLVGVQTLQTLSDRTGVAIPTSDQPFLASLSDDTLLVGSPLHVSLDGYDPNGGPLTYTVTSDNADVTGTILSGNRSARINVTGYGDMVFELFEQRAPRATSRMIELAESGFYKDIIFHRVINDFVIQGGDPTGTGRGGSTLGNFDDQFNPDLQHNRTGLLSMAKTTDDTNDSQFFITEGPSRNLDFNHTIFGVLVEGEANRNAISDTAVNGSRPINPVVMEGIDIFNDQENGVLMLKAAEGATGSANITVTVTDQNGNSFEQTFKVNLANDTSNGSPYLGDLAAVSTARNTVAEVQLTSTDVEGDPVFYTAQKVGSVNYTLTVSPTGLVSVIPPNDFVGTIEVLVGVGRVANSPDDLQQLKIEFT